MITKNEKEKRMEVRRNIKNREPAPAAPRGQFPEYLIANACFKCKKSFKKSPEAIEPICPQCSEPLSEMGRSFKAPKKTYVEQWRKIEKLWEAGFRFVGSGYHSGPALPERLTEVDQFIANNPDHPLKVAPDKTLD